MLMIRVDIRSIIHYHQQIVNKRNKKVALNLTNHRMRLTPPKPRGAGYNGRSLFFILLEAAYRLEPILFYTEAI